MIKITLKNGIVHKYQQNEYSEYQYDGKCFIVIKNKQWIGLFNIDCIESIKISSSTKYKKNENSYIFYGDY